MYLRQQIKCALDFSRPVKENVIRDMDAEQRRLCILEFTGYVWCIHEVRAIETNDEPCLCLGKVVLAECVDNNLGVVEDVFEPPVLLQIVAQLYVNESWVHKQ